jgi:glycosyltransferase involved in cell wall biosynthesis
MRDLLSGANNKHTGLVSPFSRSLLRRFAATAAVWAHLIRAEWPTLRRRRNGGRASERSLLLLADRLPPDRVHGGSYRQTSFLQYARENGWRVTAITTELGKPPDRAALELASRIPKDCSIIRVPAPSFQASRRVIPSIDGTIEMALQVFEAGWRRFRESPPAVVVATGPQFHNFLAAFYLSRRFGSRLVLDYRDEWTECPFSFVQIGKWDRAIESRILKHADGALFTTQSQLDHALRSFRQLRPEKCFLLPNGYDPSNEPMPSESPVGDSSRTVIAFVGHLAPHTHPGRFLDMLEELVASNPELADRVRLRLVGSIDPSVEERLDKFSFPNMIERVGFVPLYEAKREMAGADLLILFAGCDLVRYLPGKLFEYLAAGRPIMIFGESGEAADLVSSLSAGRRVSDARDFLDFLADLDELEGTLGGTEIRTWLAEYRRDVLVGRFYDILEGIIVNALFNQAVTVE